MENQKSENVMSSKTECKLLHVKVMNGTMSDVYEVGEAMKQLKDKLPYRIEAIVTTDKLELTDINSLVLELLKLKKQIDSEKKLT